MIALRPYQQDLADAIRAKYAARHVAVLAVSPTGSGKTVLFSYIAHNAAALRQAQRPRIVPAPPPSGERAP